MIFFVVFYFYLNDVRANIKIKKRKKRRGKLKLIALRPCWVLELHRSGEEGGCVAGGPGWGERGGGGEFQVVGC